MGVGNPQGHPEDTHVAGDRDGCADIDKADAACVDKTFVTVLPVDAHLVLGRK